MSRGQPVALDIRPSSPPSPSSSFEEVQYPAANSNSWQQQHNNQRQEELLPLHHSSAMEDKTRRRHIGGEQLNGAAPTGWAPDAAQPAQVYSPYTPVGPSEAIWQDADGKNVYEKAGFGTGRLPMPRSKRPPPPSSFVSTARSSSLSML